MGVGFSGLTAGLSSGAGCDFALEPVAGATTLTLSNVDAPDPVNDGGNITYTITATNTAGGDAVSVVVTITLDAAVTFVSNVGTGWTFTRVGQVITARADMIPSGVAPVITVVATAPTGSSTSVTTTASIVAANAAVQNANATTSVIGAIAGVTRDATNRNYYPADDTEETAFMTGIGLATGNSVSIWNLQESSGNYADAKGVANLSDLGSTVHQVAITGATRKGMSSSDGVANRRAINTTTAPNPSTTDILVVSYWEFPGSAPAANRDMAGLAAASTFFDILWLASGQIRLVNGSNADTTRVGGYAGVRGWFAYRSRLTATAEAALYTPFEKINATAATPLSGNVIWFGGQTGLGCGVVQGYKKQYTGAQARITDAQLKTLLQGHGETILW